MEFPIVFSRYEATDYQREEIDRSAGNLEILGSECIEAKGFDNY